MNERKKLIPYKMVKKINIFDEEYVEIYHGEEYVNYINNSLEEYLEKIKVKRYKPFKNYDGDNLIEEGILFYENEVEVNADYSIENHKIVYTKMRYDYNYNNYDANINNIKIYDKNSIKNKVMCFLVITIGFIFYILFNN